MKKKVLSLIGKYGAALVALSCGANVISPYDPLGVYSVYGYDRPALPKKQTQCTAHVLPFYSLARTAKDTDRNKVDLGDRLGMVNMLGLLINDTPSSYDVKFGDADSADESVLHAAYDALATHVVDNADDAVFLGDTYEPLESADARVNWGKYSVKGSYKRVGARFGVDFSFHNGVGINVRSGMAEYEMRIPAAGYTANPVLSDGSYVNAALTAEDASVVKIIQSKLMATARRTEAGTALGLDFGTMQKTSIEDTTCEVYWRKGFSLTDDEGDHVVTAYPLFSLAVTLPTAEKKKIGGVYDVALGNDGFYGFTGLAEVSFDFPGMIKIGVGASGTVFNEEAIGKQFVPTSEYQSVVYPWQVSVTKRPGVLWRVYSHAAAYNFIDFLSAFMGFTYVAHEKDSITVTGAGKDQFVVDQLAEDGRYDAQIIHLGFEYAITPALKAGLMVGATFTGKQVARSTMIAGSISCSF